MMTRSKENKLLSGKKKSPPPAKGPAPISAKRKRLSLYQDDRGSNGEVLSSKKKMKIKSWKEKRNSNGTGNRNTNRSNQNGTKSTGPSSSSRYNKSPRSFFRETPTKAKAALPKVDRKNPHPNSWWTGGGPDDRRGTTQQKQAAQERRGLFHGIDGALKVDPASLGHLSRELEAFAGYVRLTEAECQSREYLVRKIREHCGDLFGVDGARCLQVFGSFAARSVCIFESDVDLAVWGVVPPDREDDVSSRDARKERPIRALKRGNSAMSASNDTEGASDGKGEEVKVHPNQKKQERVMRWKKLLDEYEHQSGVSGEQGKTGETGKDSRNEVGNHDEGGNGSENSMRQGDPKDDGRAGGLGFVLDRFGTSDVHGLESGATVARVASVGAALDTANNNEDEEQNHASDDFQDSDDDSADKLEALQSRPGDVPLDETTHQSAFAGLSDGNAGADGMGRGSADGLYERDDDGDDDGDEEFDERAYDDDRPRKRFRGDSLLSLPSSTTGSEDDRWNDSQMEVSYLVDAKASPMAKCGPSGQTKTKVINALYRLTRPLGPYATNLHVRKKARVPIINMVTRFGYECDIAIGGHNGTDTSSYASAQASRFKSFSILVVVLKIVLSQQGLDKPFTGGLGSYVLYVLVANHLERHLALGGIDTPGEALLSFFFRYAGFNENHTINRMVPSSYRTYLKQHEVIQTTDGGSADMKNCFQLEKCITVFRLCFFALHARVNDRFDRSVSMLQYIVDAPNLDDRRGQSSKLALAKMRVISSEGESPIQPPIPSPVGIPIEMTAKQYSVELSSQFEDEKKELAPNEESESLVSVQPCPQIETRPTPLGNFNVYSGLNTHITTLSRLIRTQEEYQEVEQQLIQMTGYFEAKAKAKTEEMIGGPEFASLPAVHNRKFSSIVEPARMQRRKTIKEKEASRGGGKLRANHEPLVIEIDDSD